MPDDYAHVGEWNPRTCTCRACQPYRTASDAYIEYVFVSPTDGAFLKIRLVPGHSPVVTAPWTCDATYRGEATAHPVKVVATIAADVAATRALLEATVRAVAKMPFSGTVAKSLLPLIRATEDVQNGR